MSAFELFPLPTFVMYLYSIGKVSIHLNSGPANRTLKAVCKSVLCLIGWHEEERPVPSGNFAQVGSYLWMAGICYDIFFGESGASHSNMKLSISNLHFPRRSNFSGALSPFSLHCPRAEFEKRGILGCRFRWLLNPLPTKIEILGTYQLLKLASCMAFLFSFSFNSCTIDWRSSLLPSIFLLQ